MFFFFWWGGVYEIMVIHFFLVAGTKTIPFLAATFTKYNGNCKWTKLQISGNEIVCGSGLLAQVQRIQLL